MDTQHLNLWIELSEAAYQRNLRFFRERVGRGVELSAVVKANAYGHGWRQIAELAARHGADSFCVHSLDEALQLREAGLKHDVLIMGHVPHARLEEAVREDFRLVGYNAASLVALADAAERLGRRARVHMKLETGTHRQGISGDELGPFLEILATRSTLRLEGVYTHFANIEDTIDHSYAQEQIDCFSELMKWIAEAGFGVAKHHAACSAATLLFPRTRLDMVRLGISQYGLWPSKETFISYRHRQLELGGSEDAESLRPVLTWKTRVSQVKSVPANRAVGYGCTYHTTRPSRLAILPVGYSDGYDRRLSNQAHVLIRGQRAPIRGRVCMNLTIVDVTDIPAVELEEEVVLLGAQGERQVTAEDHARWCGTLAYEILARIRAEIPRLVLADLGEEETLEIDPGSE